MSPDPTPASAAPSLFAGRARWITIPAVLACLAYCLHLWPEWRRNPDLSHGFFAPIIFALLIAESRRGARRWLPETALWRSGLIVSGLVAVVLFGIAGLLAASVGWSHALVEFVLAAALAALLGVGLLGLAGERMRVLPFNWISLTAIGLWMLSAPLPHGLYARLTLALQSNVTTSVLHALNLIGVPARQHGNIIELARTTVGVEEACSGIRSLLSCLYAGLFFAAWQVRSIGGRTTLIVLAPLLAVVMNFIRSLTLTLMANGGVDISGFWHDATGFAILGVTALILGALALLLSPKAETISVPPVSLPPGQSRSWSTALFLSTSAGIAALALFFAFYARPAAVTAQANPAFATLLPAQADGWEVDTAKGLYQFSDILLTQQLAQRSYFRMRDGQVVQLTVYIAHWAPGQAPVSLVASHTPDACWPGSGWSAAPINNPEPSLAIAGQSLPQAEYRIFKNPAGYPQHVWFWHLYGGRPINYRDPYSVPALLELALRYGFRREGEQYFIRVSSNQPWERIAGEPLVREIFSNLARVGLTP